MSEQGSTLSDHGIVDVSGVTLRRNGATILEDIDWRILPGEHWVLLGANGSGKTTLLKVLTGYEWASAGAVHVLGRRFGSCDVRELRKTIGWVSSALHMRIPAHGLAEEAVLSGFDASLGVYRDFSDAERRIAGESLERMTVGHLAKRMFGTLSQGEQQRVLIARALVNRPAVLILDEPCAGLDPAAREHFLGDLAAFVLEADAPTTILVTHHVEEVGPWVTHGLVLRKGRVLADGELGAVLRDDVASAMLDAPCRVHVDAGRYRLEMSRVD